MVVECASRLSSAGQAAAAKLHGKETALACEGKYHVDVG